MKVLRDELHFGRYGKVLKSILNPSYPYKKGVNYQAYATYESELDAALAIVVLNYLNSGPPRHNPLRQALKSLLRNNKILHILPEGPLMHKRRLFLPPLDSQIELSRQRRP